MAAAGLARTRLAAVPDTAGGARGGAVLLDAAAAGALVAEWQALAEAAAEDNAFFHPAFALPAMGRLGPDVAVAAVRDGAGRLAAVAPVRRCRLGHIAPALRTFSHAYAPLGLPLLARDDPGRAAALLLSGIAGSASLIVPEIPLDGPVASALAAAAAAAGRPVAVLDPHERAMLTRPAGEPDSRGTLPARRRKEYGRQMRRLADRGAVAVEAATSPEAVAAALEAYLALEAAGWKGRRGTALASSPATAAFAREAVMGCARRGTARIDSLSVAGRPVAILVTIRGVRTAFTWKIAFDESFAAFSPGAQLMLDAGDAIFKETPVAWIDSCAAPGHPMIDHLWRGRLSLGLLVVGPPGGGAAYRAGLAGLAAEIEARQWLRRLRGRLRRRPSKKETES